MTTQASARPAERMPARSGQFPGAAFSFAALSVLAVVGFWKPYFARLFEGIDPYTHAHALSMSLWCLLLVGQALLVRTGRTGLHRTLGQASYVLAPSIALAATLLAHHRLQAGLDRDRIVLFFVQVGTLGLFLAGVGLGILARKRRAWHARFIIAGSLTMIDPVMARIALFHFPDLVPLSDHTVPGVTIPLLLALALRDRRRARGGERLVFPLAAIALALYQVGLWLVPSTESWRRFAAWFASLPLT